MKGQKLNTRSSNGITLIALIITIVILLILAIVTIGAVQESGIIGHAQNASSKYTIAGEKEQIGLAVSEWQIQKTLGTTQTFEEVIRNALQGQNVSVDAETNELLKVTFNKTGNAYTVTENGAIEGPLGSTGGDSTGGEGGGSVVTPPPQTDMPVAEVGTKTNENSTINGQMYSSTNPIIPAGYAPIDITGEYASSWNAANLAEEIEKGLVITDDTTARDEYGNTVGNEFVWIPVSEADFSSFAVPQSEGSENYKGVLDTTIPLYKEPAVVTNDTYSMTHYQDKFDDMVASVAKYGGFYVGRYETSLSGSTAQSKAGQPVMNNINWYEMYTSSEAYSQSGVISEMIWGCQWDAMMRFIGSRANETGNVSHDFDDPYSTGGTDYTKDDYNDISSNIYDLEGNVSEWTQEANTAYGIRVYRGGYYYDSRSPSFRVNLYSPTYAIQHTGSRLALYVEL